MRRISTGQPCPQKPLLLFISMKTRITKLGHWQKYQLNRVITVTQPPFKR